MPFTDAGGLIWANDFAEIADTLRVRSDLRQTMIQLLQQDMPGKVTEGSDRVVRFRLILADVINGSVSLPEAFALAEQRIPRGDSPHASNNRVFPADWGERQVRTQFSRLYNQAVLETIIGAGEVRCFVPHSSAEEGTSRCTQVLAGRTHEAAILHALLVDSYTNGNWGREVKLPEHPHCTHVVTPVHS